MDGFVLTETLRRTERFRRTPVVLVTGLGSDRDRLRGLTAGASAYLAKSAFDHQTLLDTVAGLL
jgi:two-component system chemotaxis sensor kinase CheA